MGTIISEHMNYGLCEQIGCEHNICGMWQWYVVMKVGRDLTDDSILRWHKERKMEETERDIHSLV